MNTIKEFLEYVRNHPGVERDDDGLYLSLDDGWDIEFEVEEDGITTLDVTRWNCPIIDSIIHEVGGIEEIIYVHWADYDGPESNATKLFGVIQTTDPVDMLVSPNDDNSPESVLDFIEWVKSL